MAHRLPGSYRHRCISVSRTIPKTSDSPGNGQIGVISKIPQKYGTVLAEMLTLSRYSELLEVIGQELL